MNGGLVYVMGPSGAGKDSLIAYARAHGPRDWPVAFAHRYITRPATAGGENHVALSPVEFDRLDRRGLFTFRWEAHGEHYGIGREIDRWRETGLTVVVNGSRGHFAAIRAKLADAIPVLVTARPETLAARLAARGREGAEAIAERLRRAGAAVPIDPTLRVIENDGALADAGETLVATILDAVADVREKEEQHGRSR